MKPNNPFLITGYHSPEYFCNRKQETETILEALYNGRNLTLIASRRMGKTGLIQHAFHQLNEREPDIVTLYLDIFSTQNLEEFVLLLASTVLESLDSTPQKAVSKIGKWLKNLRPVLMFDELTGAPNLTAQMTAGQEEASLKEIFAYLQSSGKRCYIAIDEFQQIAEYPEKGVEALLRSHIQFLTNVNFVFAGSKQHVMQEMFLSAKRPFYQSTQLLPLNRIDHEAYFDFAAAFFDKKKHPLSPEVFTYIYNEFEGHTWYIQAILNRLYQRPGQTGIADVNQAIEQILSESTYSYETLLSAYTATHIRLLKAIAREKCVQSINAGEFIARYRLKASSSVNTALKKLTDKELVYKTTEGYIVYDRFMAIWLRQQSF